MSPYNMPELRWRYGYVAFWGVMLTMLAAMLWFFRSRGWSGTRLAGDEKSEDGQ